LRNNHALTKQTQEYCPLHITLAYPAKVDILKPTKNTVKKMVFDEVVIVKKENEEKYTIHRKVKF